MHHSQWFDDERDLKIGDTILFLKHDISFKNTYQYKMVENVKYSKEEKIRKVKIKHRNDNEKTKGDVQYAKIGELATAGFMKFTLSSRC